MNTLSVLLSTAGKFASVTYTNNKGVTKDYVVRLGVKKHLAGGVKYFVPNSLTVYSLTKGNVGYKTFMAHRIERIKCGSINFSK